MPIFLFYREALVIIADPFQLRIFCDSELELDTALKMCPHQCSVEGKITSLGLLGIPFLMQLRIPLAIFSPHQVAG